MPFNPKTFRRLEFYLLVLTWLASWVASIADQLPTTYAIYASVGSSALYAVYRGFAKYKSDTKDFWQTTEFWVTLVGALLAGVMELNDNLPHNAFKVLIALLGGAVGLANALRIQGDVAAGNVPAQVLRDELAFVPDDPALAPRDGDDSVHAPKQ